MWYCAHAIFRYQYEGQTSITVHENVYLIDASDPDEALLSAEKIALEHEMVGAESALKVNGVRAEYRFSGIRKLIAVESDESTAAGRICSGVEVTYSVMEVGSLREVEVLAAGGSATVVYVE
ncbi:MAG: DUF4288 domain-containing protein [Stenotrophomonas sp.]|uniref:DUF4288 domain-containing protein n=1 Tax=Stenotrophomonas sp. TaxID=69392 RepID=UPI003D6D037D